MAIITKAAVNSEITTVIAITLLANPSGDNLDRFLNANEIINNAVDIAINVAAAPEIPFLKSPIFVNAINAPVNSPTKPATTPLITNISSSGTSDSNIILAAKIATDLAIVYNTSAFAFNWNAFNVFPNSSINEVIDFPTSLNDLAIADRLSVNPVALFKKFFNESLILYRDAVFMADKISENCKLPTISLTFLITVIMRFPEEDIISTMPFNAALIISPILKFLTPSAPFFIASICSSIVVGLLLSSFENRESLMSSTISVITCPTA